MKIYEGLVLVTADRGGEAAVEHVQAVLEKSSCELVRLELYGEKKLAYEINKQKRGVYVLAAFRQSAEGMITLNRDLNLDEYILRHLILDRSNITLEKFFNHYKEVDEGARAPVREMV